MDIPEAVRQLIEEMGVSVMAAVSEDPRCRALALAIQQHGWDANLLVETTITLHRKGVDGPQGLESDASSWSEADRDFLHTFRIRLD